MTMSWNLQDSHKKTVVDTETNFLGEATVTIKGISLKSSTTLEANATIEGIEEIEDQIKLNVKT